MKKLISVAIFLAFAAAAMGQTWTPTTYANQDVNQAATPSVVTIKINGATEFYVSTASVNLNTATATTLYTVPAGKTAIITKVVLRNVSTSLTTASVSFGFESTTFANVIADATHTELTGATLYTVLSPKAGAAIGAAAGTFKILANTLQGAAATATVDVWGYLF